MNSLDNVVVCSRSFSENEILREEILNKYSNVKFNDDGLSLKGDNLIDFVKDATVVISGLEPFNKMVINELPNLKVLGKFGVGLDNLDLNEMIIKKIKLGWIPGVNKRSVAELVVSNAINLLRKISFSDYLIKNGQWPKIQGKQLSEITFGIYGLGNIGKEVAKMLKPFGCNILTFDIVDYSEFCKSFQFSSVDEDEILSSSDILSLHIPLTEETRGLFDGQKMSQMKKGSFLINTSRGGIVKESDLKTSLDKSHIQGAAFDVFEFEPEVNIGLVNHPHFISTPHIGGTSSAAKLAMGRAAIEGILNPVTLT